MACKRQTSISSASDELEILKSIYLDEIEELSTNENSGRSLLFTVKPTVDDNGISKQYHSLQLEITIPVEYPTLPVEVKIRNPRGLMDEELNVLNSQIVTFLHQNKGQPVLFDVIQLAQDFLSSTDVPKLPCSICLNGFHSEDTIFVTKQCHHHFHSACLGRYVEHVLEEKNIERASLPPLLRDEVTNEIVCPLCRCSIDYDLPSLLAADLPKLQSDLETFDWSELSNPIEKGFRELYEKQKEKGGLIDIDEENKRLLVTEDTRILFPPSSSSATNNLVDSNEITSKDAIDEVQSVGPESEIKDNKNKPKQNSKGEFRQNFSTHRGRGGGRHYDGGGGGHYYGRGGYYGRKNTHNTPRNYQDGFTNRNFSKSKSDGSENSKCNKNKEFKNKNSEGDTINIEKL